MITALLFTLSLAFGTPASAGLNPPGVDRTSMGTTGPGGPTPTTSTTESRSAAPESTTATERTAAPTTDRPGMGTSDTRSAGGTNTNGKLQPQR
jgi:hypothetical protein